MKSIPFYALVLLAASLLLTAPAAAQTAQDGYKYLDNEEPAKARAVFSQLAATGTAQNLYYMGSFLLSQGQPDSAKTYFDQALAAEPKSPFAHIGMGELEIAKGNLAGAKTHFDQAAKVSKSRNGEVFYRMGLAYTRFNSKDPKLAEQHLDKAKDLDNKNGDYWFALGDLYLANRNAGKATQAFESAIYFNPTMAKAHMRAGDLFLLAKDYTQALRKYQEAVTADPEFAPAYRELADLYFRGRQYANAATNYKLYMEKAGPDPEKQFVYAGYLYLDKKYPEAIAVLQPLEAEFANPVVHRLLAYSYYEMKDYQNGVAQIEKYMAEAKPEDVITQDHESFGRLQLAAGKDTLAGVNALHKVAESDSSRTAALYGEIAQLYFNGRKFAEAAAEYEMMASKGIKLGAQDLLNQGKAYYFSQQYDKADTAFGVLTEIASQSNVGWMWRARTNARLDPESTEGRARPYYEKAIELSNTDPTKYVKDLVESNWYLGYYHYKKEDVAASRPYIEAVLKLDPEHQNAKILMEELAKAN